MKMSLKALDRYEVLNQEQMIDTEGGFITLLLLGAAKVLGVKKIKGGVVKVALMLDGVIVGWIANR